MDTLKEILKIAFTVQGIRDYFTVLDENKNLDWSQLAGTVIQTILFIALILAIGIAFY